MQNEETKKIIDLERNIEMWRVDCNIFLVTPNGIIGGNTALFPQGIVGEIEIIHFW